MIGVSNEALTLVYKFPPWPIVVGLVVTKTLDKRVRIWSWWVIDRAGILFVGGYTPIFPTAWIWVQLPGRDHEV